MPRLTTIGGNAFSDLGRYPEAIAVTSRAIASAPDYADAHNNRGNAPTELRRLPEALASYGDALTLKPDYEFLYGNWLRTESTRRRPDSRPRSAAD